MPNFTCTLNLNNLPAEIRRGTMARAVVTEANYSAPIRSVVISVDAYGLSQRLKRESENSFLLELKLPMLVPPGNYQYSIWAVSESGETSPRQSGRVVVK